MAAAASAVTMRGVKDPVSATMLTFKGALWESWCERAGKEDGDRSKAEGVLPFASGVGVNGQDAVNIENADLDNAARTALYDSLPKGSWGDAMFNSRTSVWSHQLHLHGEEQWTQVYATPKEFIAVAVMNNNVFEKGKVGRNFEELAPVLNSVLRDNRVTFKNAKGKIWRCDTLAQTNLTAFVTKMIKTDYQIDRQPSDASGAGASLYGEGGGGTYLYYKLIADLVDAKADAAKTTNAKESEENTKKAAEMASQVAELQDGVTGADGDGPPAKKGNKLEALLENSRSKTESTEKLVSCLSGLAGSLASPEAKMSEEELLKKRKRDEAIAEEKLEHSKAKRKALESKDELQQKKAELATAKIEIDKGAAEARLIEAKTAAAKQTADAEYRKAELEMRQEVQKGQLDMQKQMMTIMQQMASK